MGFFIISTPLLGAVLACSVYFKTNLNKINELHVVLAKTLIFVGAFITPHTPTESRRGLPVALQPVYGD